MQNIILGYLDTVIENGLKQTVHWMEALVCSLETSAST